MFDGIASALRLSHQKAQSRLGQVFVVRWKTLRFFIKVFLGLGIGSLVSLGFDLAALHQQATYNFIDVPLGTGPRFVVKGVVVCLLNVDSKKFKVGQRPPP